VRRMRSRAVALVAGVAGVGALVTAGVLLDVVDFSSTPSDDQEPPESQPLCAYLNEKIESFIHPIDPAALAPMAVLDSPYLGVAIERIDQDLDPAEDPLVSAIDAMAGDYVFVADNVIQPNAAWKVAIPGEIAGDYTVFAQGLYQAVFEQQPDVPNDPAVRRAATAVDDYVTTCDPPIGRSGNG
jgi:hypothetical protein